jgi:hypothetical protein
MALKGLNLKRVALWLFSGVTIMNKSFGNSTKAFASYQELKEYLQYHSYLSFNKNEEKRLKTEGVTYINKMVISRLLNSHQKITYS